jgi:hypothetical protein
VPVKRCQYCLIVFLVSTLNNRAGGNQQYETDDGDSNPLVVIDETP